MNQHSAREETVSKRRARGEGHIYQRGRIWWIQYYCNGDEYSKAPTLKTRAQPRVYCVALSARWRRELVVRIGKDGKPYLCGVQRSMPIFKNLRAVDSRGLVAA